MKTDCPYCGEEFEVADSAFGRRANCGACGKDFIIGQVRTKIPNKGLNTATREKPSKEKGRVLWWVFWLLVMIWLGLAVSVIVMVSVARMVFIATLEDD